MKRSRLLPLTPLLCVLAVPAYALAGAPAAKKAASPIVLGEKLPSGTGPRLDIVFVIDSTGSMGGEIDTVKAEVTTMTKDILAGKPTPDVRFGVVDYKDVGDEYRVRTLDLTRGFPKVYEFINSIYASGGGDGPESVAFALETSLYKMAWDADRNSAKMVFLIGDAPDHRYPGEKGFKELAAKAKREGIVVNTIACRDWAEMLTDWKEIASLTGGEFERLKYKGVAVDVAGAEKTVVTDGSVTYVAEGELSKADWGKDIDTLKKEKKVRAAKAGEFAATAATGYGSGLRGSDGAPAAAAAPAPAYIGRDKSDVGARMLDAVKRAAKAKGVAY